MRPGLGALAWTALPVVAWPIDAIAHSTIEGIDAVYGGFLHPYFVPAHLLSLIGLGLAVGLMGRTAALRTLPVFAVALTPAYLAALIVRFPRAWLVFGARVLGSWITAASLMVLALAAAR